MFHPERDPKQNHEKLKNFIKPLKANGAQEWSNGMLAHVESTYSSRFNIGLSDSQNINPHHQRRLSI
jgi:hypothetical protein